MVIVAIIMIFAAAAAPSLSSAMADRRTNEAAHALVRIGARARSESIAYGRAHLLVFNNTGATANGTIALWRGRANLCSANVWNDVGVAGSCAASPSCLEALDMIEYDHGTNQVRMRLAGAAARSLCFQPDGELLLALTPAGPFSVVAPGVAAAGAGGVRFDVNRLTNNAPVGVPRQVVFPFGGNPRIVR